MKIVQRQRLVQNIFTKFTLILNDNVLSKETRQLRLKSMMRFVALVNKVLIDWKKNLLIFYSLHIFLFDFFQDFIKGVLENIIKDLGNIPGIQFLVSINRERPFDSWAWLLPAFVERLFDVDLRDVC